MRPREIPNHWNCGPRKEKNRDSEKVHVEVARRARRSSTSEKARSQGILKEREIIRKKPCKGPKTSYRRLSGPGGGKRPHKNESVWGRAQKKRNG